MKLVTGQKGMTLIEVLIAIAILGMIAVPFLTALSTSSRGIIIADERTTAESLVRSEIEYVKSQGYKATGNYTDIADADIPVGFYVYLVNVTELMPGLQKITVTVERDGEVVLTTSTYNTEHL
jgi:prepilin-type N-terminal cleavage/methylation domain-containing protein